MELSTQEEWKTHLMSVNQAFRLLVERHSKLDLRVTELEAKDHPTEEEVLEESTLKKEKLRLKDQISDMMGKLRLQGVA